jgi:hypothetical protein
MQDPSHIGLGMKIKDVKLTKEDFPHLLILAVHLISVEYAQKIMAAIK